MALDEPKETDQKFCFDELTFIVDGGLLETTGGISIDYFTHQFGGGFKIEPKKPLPKDEGDKSCGTCSC